MSALRRVLNAIVLWGLLGCAMLTCAAGMNPGFHCTKEKAYLAAMKSDLRNMVTAQEMYFEAHRHYASNSALQSDGMGGLFRSSTGVTIRIESADATSWRARTTHVAIKDSCAIAVGGNLKDGPDGEPRCEGTTARRRAMRPEVILLNLSVDFWLFAFSVVGAQRKRELPTG